MSQGPVLFWQKIWGKQESSLTTVWLKWDPPVKWLTHSGGKLHRTACHTLTNKRSLIPIICMGLSYLCRTATEADSKTVCSSFSMLAKGQEEIVLSADDNISVINITRAEMSENRQALNKIVGSLANLGCKVRKYYTSIRKEVFQVGQFVQLYLQLDSIIHTL